MDNGSQLEASQRYPQNNSQENCISKYFMLKKIFYIMPVKMFNKKKSLQAHTHKKELYGTIDVKYFSAL